MTNPEKEQAQVLEAHELQHVYLENLGTGDFAIKPLPRSLHMAPIQDFHVEDLDQDGWLDVLAVGNAYDTEVKIGRYDAFKGAWLKGGPGGTFELKLGPSCGFHADKDARNLARLELANGDLAFLVANKYVCDSW